MINIFFFFYDNPWADIIKQERKEQQLTQTDLGKLIGKSMRAIQTYESGKVIPSDKVLASIASVFGLSIAALLDKYDYYTEAIPSHFDGNAEEYETYKKEVEKDSEAEKITSRESIVTAHRKSPFDDITDEEAAMLEAFLEAYRANPKNKK